MEIPSNCCNPGFELHVIGITTAGTTRTNGGQAIFLTELLGKMVINSEEMGGTKREILTAVCTWRYVDSC